MRQISLIGSTGSIGRNTLNVVEHLQDQFSVFALSAHSAIELLAEQVAKFRPKMVVLTRPDLLDHFCELCRAQRSALPEVVTGSDGLRQISSAQDVDIVVSAAVGAAGLPATYAAVAAGKTVALANKESMVIGGELLRRTAQRTAAQIIPVDSEHCAVDQCLRAGRRNEVKRIILTASGGPFRELPADQFSSITPEQALKHPTWKMGKRITIDSATLMNKGLEVIEARWLFDVPAEKIDILVHPQSIVHSMVEFVDGSIIAQLGTADMRQPIQYALTYPDRTPSALAPLDWNNAGRLDFAAPDHAKFPCVGLAYEALRIGGTAPTVVNAVDEIAVEAFLNRRIPFQKIPELIAEALDKHHPQSSDSVDAILEADKWARDFTRSLCELPC